MRMLYFVISDNNCIIKAAHPTLEWNAPKNKQF